jgi:SSS family solute:Na+ symporter
MMAFYLFCACIVMQVGFSYIFPVQHNRESSQLYWKSPWEPLRGIALKGIGNYKVLSALLLLIIGVLYYVFR